LFLRQEERTFRLDRILDVKVIEAEKKPGKAAWPLTLASHHFKITSYELQGRNF